MIDLNDFHNRIRIIDQEDRALQTGCVAIMVKS